MSTDIILPPIIADRVKKLRIDKGFSVEFLAEKSGLSIATIKQLERGKKDSYASTIKKVALALETSIDYLYGCEMTDEISLRILYSQLSENQKKVLVGLGHFMQLTGSRYVP